MMKQAVRAFAPATVSNVGPGFDSMGFAIHDPGDQVTVRTVPDPGVRIVKITGDSGKLSYRPDKNTASIAVTEMSRRVDFDFGVEIELEKNMPIGSGMGSSAASAVAGVYALNELLGNPLSKEDLLECALEGERFASGAPHADNAAPCLFGGFVIVREASPPDVISIKTPENLVCTLINPDIEVKTLESRKLLPESIPLTKAVAQWSNTAALVSGLMSGNMDLVGRSMQDIVVEPCRIRLIPGFDKMKAAALEAGALGCGISGSGPSVFALSKDEDTAEAAGQAMKLQLDALNVSCRVIVSRINSSGPRIIG